MSMGRYYSRPLLSRGDCGRVPGGFDPGIPFYARPGDYPAPADLWERTGLARPLASAATPIA